MPEPNQNKSSFFQTLPGILTACATLISALVAGYIAINKKETTTPVVYNPNPVYNNNAGGNPPAVEQRTITPEVKKEIETVDLTGTWTNNTGYIVINQNGSAFSYNDFAPTGITVGQGNGRLTGNLIYLNGYSMTEDGSQLNYTAECKLVNHANEMVGTISIEGLDAAHNISFFRKQ